MAASGILVERTLRHGAGHFHIECEIRRGSPNLEAVYVAASSPANDTSFGVGCWLYSPLGRLVIVSRAPLTVALCAAVEEVTAAGLERTGELARRLENEGVGFHE